MEVWVLTGGYRYEGSYVLGVYHTEQDASKAADEHRKKYDEKGLAFDFYNWHQRVIGARPDLIRFETGE